MRGALERPEVVTVPWGLVWEGTVLGLVGSPELFSVPGVAGAVEGARPSRGLSDWGPLTLEQGQWEGQPRWSPQGPRRKPWGCSPWEA
jgi:hypothetical protein